jgi:hypothetical protein
MQRFEVLAAGETDAAAADCAADLPVSRALVAVLVVRKRLFGTLRLPGNYVRNAVRQTARLREQQGKNQGQDDEYGALHAGHFNRCNAELAGSYSLSSLSDGVNDQVRVMVRMSVSRVMSGGSGE